MAAKALTRLSWLGPAIRERAGHGLKRGGAVVFSLPSRASRRGVTPCTADRLFGELYRTRHFLYCLPMVFQENLTITALRPI